jgi:hypothetical protein
MPTATGLGGRRPAAAAVSDRLEVVTHLPAHSDFCRVSPLTVLDTVRTGAAAPASTAWRHEIEADSRTARRPDRYWSVFRARRHRLTFAASGHAGEASVGTKHPGY